MLNASVHIHFIRVTLDNAARHGIDTRNLLAKSGISPRLLRLGDARVSARQFADLQTAAMLAMDDELLGNGPFPMRVGTWSALCHWLIHARNLNHAIRRLCRFYTLTEHGFNPQLFIRGNLAVTEIHPWNDGTDYSINGYEQFLFSFHRLLCWLAREKLPFQRVELPFSQPDHYREYRYMFYGYPVDYSGSVCRISFHRSVLDKPVRQDIQNLREFLKEPLYEIIDQDYDRSSWSSRIREALAEQRGPAPSLENIALQLGIQPHTLRRRLAAEGQTYIEIKQQVKRDLAIHYLSNRNHSIEEIAFRTGFSEASAFIRAFKQWTGVTPYTYRKGQ